MQKELKDRLITAGLLITITAGLLVGAHFFKVFRYLNLAVVFTLVALCAFEVSAVASENWKNLKKGIIYLLILVAIPLGTLLGLSSNNLDNLLAINRVSMFYPLTAIWLVMLVLLLLELWPKRTDLQAGKSITNEILPMLILVGVGGACLEILAINESSSKLILWLILVVALADTAAYFAGKKFGVTKIAPALSPNKTIVGAVASLATALVVGWSTCSLIGLQEQPFFAIFVAIFAGFLAQVGDFAKSYFKRLYQVKDFSQLLPGHGGLMDRLDAILAVAPLVCFIFLAV